MASYRSELFTPDEPAFNLRSTGEALLAVPKSNHFYATSFNCLFLSLHQEKQQSRLENLHTHME